MSTAMPESAPTITISTPSARKSTQARQEAMPEKVSIRNLNFFYDQHRALKDISLSLYANKATAFIGPSGCGKSTLLRVLNRMYDLYPNQRASGEVMLDGENILAPGNDLNMLRARIGSNASSLSTRPFSSRMRYEPDW